MCLIPEMEEMAEKYKDRVLFLKINADKEKELCSMFNVVALPTLLFIPVGGKPIIETGATPEKYEQIIREQLLKKWLEGYNNRRILLENQCVGIILHAGFYWNRKIGYNIGFKGVFPRLIMGIVWLLGDCWVTVRRCRPIVAALSPDYRRHFNRI